MTAKALQYAEETLGVHEVYKKVMSQLDDLDKLLSDLDAEHDEKRALNELLADREVDLIDEMRTVHISMSDTRFNAEMKSWKRQDSKLMALQGQINQVLSKIQGLEYDADLLKLRIRVGSSRMEELGGYLHYLAAVKASGTPTPATPAT